MKFAQSGRGIDKQGDPQTYAIIGAAMDVHRALGRGFLESVYREALTVELESRGIPFVREAPLSVTYKGQILPCQFRADFLCFNRIIVELKAVARLSAVEDAQVLNYLKVSGLEVGLLFNFAAPSLQHKRFVLSKADFVSDRGA